MTELKNNEFSSITQLLNEEKVHCTFAYAVVEGKQPGQIYVDNHINPTCCLVTCRGGKYLVAGDTSNIIFNEFLSDYLGWGETLATGLIALMGKGERK